MQGGEPAGAIGTSAAAAFGPLFVPQRGSSQGLGGREDRDIVHFFNTNPAELRRRGAGTSVTGTAAGSSRHHLDASSVRDRPVREIVIHVKSLHAQRERIQDRVRQSFLRHSGAPQSSFHRLLVDGHELGALPPYPTSQYGQSS
jgi:hypothetical protein